MPSTTRIQRNKYAASQSIPIVLPFLQNEPASITKILHPAHKNIGAPPL